MRLTCRFVLAAVALSAIVLAWQRRGSRVQRAGREQRVARPGWAIDRIEPDLTFRGEVSVEIAAEPADVFHAFREVTVLEMPIARALGAIRYLPGKVLGRPAPEATADEPFVETLLRSGTVLLSETDSEMVFGSAGKYHQVVNQEPAPFEQPEDFEQFVDPDFQKLVISLRAEPANVPGRTRLTLEHRTHPLGSASRRKFGRYWLVIRPMGNFVSKQLLLAVKRRAESTPG